MCSVLRLANGCNVGLNSVPACIETCEVRCSKRNPCHCFTGTCQCNPCWTGHFVQLVRNTNVSIYACVYCFCNMFMYAVCTCICVHLYETQYAVLYALTINWKQWIKERCVIHFSCSWHSSAHHVCRITYVITTSRYGEDNSRSRMHMVY